MSVPVFQFVDITGNILLGRILTGTLDSDILREGWKSTKQDGTPCSQHDEIKNKKQKENRWFLCEKKTEPSVPVLGL